jgi:hypothetical protein
MRFPIRFLLASLVILFATTDIQAHFFWLVPTDESGSKVNLYFSEGPEPGNPALLKKLANVHTTPFRSNKPSAPVSFQFTENDGRLTAHSEGATTWTLSHTYGTHGQDEKNLIVYTASSVACTRPGMIDNDWIPLPRKGFTIEPEFNGKELAIRLFIDEKASGEFEFEIQSSNDQRTIKTDAAGLAKVQDIKPGVCAVRCLKTEDTPGEFEGVPYKAVKKYTTISFIVPDLKRASLIPAVAGKEIELPKAITSFGATRLGESIYVYGGHTGGAHSYSNEEQFNVLATLNVSSPTKWESIAEGPRVQGNALVADSQSVILVGGFTAVNAKGEKSRLVSQSLVQQFDLKSMRWNELPSLPEPRSSMDAICLNGYIYVVGGWSMTGTSDETKWLDTVWRMSLEKKDAWEKMASTPFLRRAIALAAHQKKIYVIGGMKDSGEPTTNVDCFDPTTNSWTSIAPISGVPLTGFGAAAAVVDGKLIVSTVDGAIQQLDDSTQTWRIVGQVETGRFFHRIVPTTNHEFAIIGGANMSIGKFKETEFVRLLQ